MSRALNLRRVARRKRLKSRAATADFFAEMLRMQHRMQEACLQATVYGQAIVAYDKDGPHVH